MKTIISTSQRANTVRHEFIKTSLYNDTQYTPVLVVNNKPQTQHVAHSISITDITSNIRFSFIYIYIYQ